MSGAKEIRITDVQWNDVQNRLNTAKRENDKLKQELEKEREKFNTRVAELSNASSREIATLNSRLADQLRAQEAALNQQMRNLNQERDRLMREQAETLVGQFQTQLNIVQADLGNSIAEIQAEMQRQNRTKREIAEFWFEQYQNLLEGVKRERNYYDNVRPGQMATFEAQLLTARNLIDNDPTAATGLMASQFANLNQFRNDLITYEGHCQPLMEAASERILSLTDQIDRDLSAEYHLDGNTYSANMNYWTNNRINELSATLGRVRDSFNNMNVLNLGELQNINRDLDTLQADLSEAELNAQRGFAASIARAYNASAVSEALRSRGWRLDNCLFVDGDKTKELSSHYVNATGKDEIVVTIGDNNVEIDQFIRSSTDPRITTQNGYAIGNCLQQLGLCGDPVTSLRPSKGYENEHFNGKPERLKPFE